MKFSDFFSYFRVILLKLVFRLKVYTLGGTRTPNLRFRRPTPYPLGHAGTVVQRSCHILMGLTRIPERDKKVVRRPGIEPGSQEWESCMIPLHQRRFDIPEQDLRNQQLFREFYSSVTSVGACRIFLEYIHSPASSVGRA